MSTFLKMTLVEGHSCAVAVNGWRMLIIFVRLAGLLLSEVNQRPKQTELTGMITQLCDVAQLRQEINARKRPLF